MRPKRCLKLFIAMVVGVCLTINVYNIYVELNLFSSDKHDSRKAKSTCVNCIDDNIKPLFNQRQQVEYYYPCYKWMLNRQVYQYSSYFRVKNQIVTHAESIVVVKGAGIKNDLIVSQMHCVFKRISTGVHYRTKILSTQYYNNQTKRIECTLPKHFTYKDINDTALAILFIDDHEFTSNRNDSTELNLLDINNGQGRLPAYLINFQIPRQIYTPAKKLKAVAHCVHYSYNLADNDVDKILNWLDMQRQFGYKKIIVYDSNINSVLYDRVYAQYDVDFVEIRPYHVHYESICDLNMLNVYEHTDQFRHRYMRDLCEIAFYNYFENPTYSSTNRWRHQYLNSNDCLHSLKHTYEFVSYFDVDEIIFPRKMNINEFAKQNGNALDCMEPSRLCAYTNQFNIYDYLHNLILTRFAHPIDKLSYLYFPNGMFMSINYYVKAYMNELVKISKRMHNTDQVETNSGLPVFEEKLFFLNQHGHTFNMTVKDVGHINLLVGLFDKLECLHNRCKADIDPSLDDTFKRFVFVATGRKHHMGKSVHYTDNVDAIFTHYATQTRVNTLTLEVDPSDGVLSHFRSDFYYLARDLSSSIDNLKIDFEYYNWLLKSKTNRCKNV